MPCIKLKAGINYCAKGLQGSSKLSDRVGALHIHLAATLDHIDPRDTAHRLWPGWRSWRS